MNKLGNDILMGDTKMIKIEDIAKIAGVSKSTVSLALNGLEGVSERKRQQILQIAKERNYQPLRQRKEKKTTLSKSYIVRLVSCNDINRFTYNFQNLPHFNELISDFSALSREYPISLLVNSISINNIAKEFQEIESHQQSDVIILLGTDLPESVIKKINHLHDKVVIIDTCYFNMKNDFISINNYLGAYQATEYLIHNGHKKIGYVKGKQRIKNFKERHRGFDDALKKNGLLTTDIPTLIFPASSISTYPNAINNRELPTAFFCENDTLAISLIKTLQDLGINVPEDISVVGFDNISEATVVTPELTTIDINRRYMAILALEKAISIVTEGNVNQTQVLINTKLIERNSVKNIN